MDSTVNFFSDGFFGYSKTQDFYMGSIWHIIPIVFLIIVLIFIYKYREKIKKFKYESSVRYILAFTMMIVEMSYFWRLLYVGNQGNYDNMMSYLPLQICQWGLIICIFTITSMNKNLFGINYYLTLLFAPIALIYPIVITSTGPTYYRYYQFWLEHILPIISVFYLMFVHNMKPQYKSIFHTLLILLPLSIISFIANSKIEEADYLYLKLNVPFLPANPILKVIVLYVLVIMFFHLMYFIFTKIDNISQKKLEKR